MTLFESSARKGPSIPRSLPCLAALLRSLLSTYPLPSFEGIIPSAIINVIDLKWSVIILIETSVGACPSLYSTPDLATTPSRICLIVSMSKIESTPCIMQAILSRPIPVSMLGCSRLLYEPSSSFENCVNTWFQNSRYLSQSQPGLQSGLPQPYSGPLSK